MGAFKPLLELGGVPALTRVIAAFRSVGATIVVTGYERERLRPLLSGVTEVYNPRFADGMLSSVKAGIKACRADFALIAPVDCALISEPLVLEVMRHPSGLAIPCYLGEEGHPLKVDASYFAEILAYSGGGGLRGFLEGYESRIARFETAYEGAILDMDTPEDYARLVIKGDAGNGRT
jgi:CTP:molybdopterin cytidylyltransferase MocA